MKLSEVILIAFLVPAMLMGFTILGVVTGNLNDDGMLLRAAIVSAVPAAAFSAAGLIIRRKAAGINLEQGGGTAAHDIARDSMIRSAA